MRRRRVSELCTLPLFAVFIMLGVTWFLYGVLQDEYDALAADRRERQFNEFYHEAHGTLKGTNTQFGQTSLRLRRGLAPPN
jgi:hypothetical protein